jgi:Hemerythrin HHE cation binding domain
LRAQVFLEEELVRHTILALTAIGLLVIAVPNSQSVLGAPTQATRATAQKTTIAIPQSLQTEHKEIHNALEEATMAPGRVGAAAKELAAVLGPHFERENEIALPPLGLLAPLAAGEKPAGMQEALAMSDALKNELPRMLQEHKQIRAATERLRTIAREEKAPVYEQFAETLTAHARSEEEVLYPAAILVGDIIRARMSQK